jgi:2,3-bisphosphoglycerate-independent phosphoglycerate mutase
LLKSLKIKTRLKDLHKRAVSHGTDTNIKHSRKRDKQRKAPPRVWGGSPTQIKDSSNRKAENNSNALPLLFSALRQILRKSHQRNKTRLHRCLCILILLRTEQGF